MLKIASHILKYIGQQLVVLDSYQKKQLLLKTHHMDY